jgi:hypothetical protein
MVLGAGSRRFLGSRVGTWHAVVYAVIRQPMGALTESKRQLDTISEHVVGMVISAAMFGYQAAAKATNSASVSVHLPMGFET